MQELTYIKTKEKYEPVKNIKSFIKRPIEGITQLSRTKPSGLEQKVYKEASKYTNTQF